jgi:hypothetical protein
MVASPYESRKGAEGGNLREPGEEPIVNEIKDSRISWIRDTSQHTRSYSAFSITLSDKRKTREARKSRSPIENEIVHNMDLEDRKLSIRSNEWNVLISAHCHSEVISVPLANGPSGLIIVNLAIAKINSSTRGSTAVEDSSPRY